MTTRFQLPDEYGQEMLEAEVADLYPFGTEPVESERRDYYDTFDWRVYRKSFGLYRCADRLVLRPLTGTGREHVAMLSGEPRFVADLPEGSLRDRLSGIVNVRALRHVASVNLETHTYRILNKDRKTVARITYAEARWPALAHEADVAGASSDIASAFPAKYVTLRPVRGYAKFERRLRDFLASIAVGPSHEGDLLLSALRAADREPDVGMNKRALGLMHGMRADDATRQIMGRLLESIRSNEAGIKSDLDTEFLHDFRISVRRTRAALGQIRLVFPADDTDRFKHRFRRLFRRTNLMRDLDVYLLAEERYRGILPQQMQDDIDPLFEYLRSQRSLALREVVAELESAEYASLLRDWSAFLKQATVPPEPTNAAVDVGDLASERIYKRFRRIVREGTYILDHPDDELLHELRLECKKLRYLLEFFSELYPPKRARRLVKQLKRLQDNLGAFVDLSVQQSFLLGTADELPIVDARTRRALVATGYLVETMARRQQDVKAEFAETFRTFASQRNRREYERLFADRSARSSS